MAMTHTDLRSLIREVVNSRIRPEFIVTSVAEGGHPKVFKAGNIALDACNMARRVRNQLRYSNVQVWSWNENTGDFDYNDKVTSQAFPPPSANKKNDNSDLARTRSSAIALSEFEAAVHTIKVSRKFDGEARLALTDAFLNAYQEIGGDSTELLDNIATVLGETEDEA